MNSLYKTLGTNLCGIFIERNIKIYSMNRMWMSLNKKYSYWRISERILTKIIRNALKYDDRKNRAFNKILGMQYISKELENIPQYEGLLNSKETVEWIKSINPDIILVYGTSIVSNEILYLAKYVALNMHTGLSPYYRGSDTYFWPLYNGEPEMVGATVHQCTSQVDGGRIYARISVRLNENDDIFTAYAKCIKAGTYIYSSVVNRCIQGNIKNADIQDLSLGREYHFSDRTFMHDLKMEVLFRSGRLKYLIKQSYENEPLFPADGLSC